jgi:hypothetical protein
MTKHRVIVSVLAMILALSGCQLGPEEEPAPAPDAGWVSDLESSIEADLDDAWEGEFADHQVACPADDVDDLSPGDTFSCVADCECVPEPDADVAPTEVFVEYLGDGAAVWEEAGTGVTGTFSG